MKIVDSYQLSSDNEQFEDEERATVKMGTLPSNSMRTQYQIDIAKYDDISNYSKNCSLKFDTQAALFCESYDGQYLFTIDTFDNIWDTLFINEGENRKAPKKYELEEKIQYFEQFGDFVDYLDINNVDFPGEPVLTEVQYAGNKIYEEDRPFWLTDDSKNTTEPITVQIN